MNKQPQGRIIKRGLYPYPARAACAAHNRKYHGGVPTAHIDPDELSTGRLPRYKVWCPVCGQNDGEQLALFALMGDESGEG